jgi:flagellar biosynthesis GTPase FlhF
MDVAPQDTASSTVQTQASISNPPDPSLPNPRPKRANADSTPSAIIADAAPEDEDALKRFDAWLLENGASVAQRRWGLLGLQLDRRQARDDVKDNEGEAEPKEGEEAKDKEEEEKKEKAEEEKKEKEEEEKKEKEEEETRKEDEEDTKREEEEKTVKNQKGKKEAEQSLQASKQNSAAPQKTFSRTYKAALGAKEDNEKKKKETTEPLDIRPGWKSFRPRKKGTDVDQ